MLATIEMIREYYGGAGGGLKGKCGLANEHFDKIRASIVDGAKYNSIRPLVRSSAQIAQPFAPQK